MLVLLLAGCGIKNANIVPVTKGIDFDCNVTYYNEVYECKGKKIAVINLIGRVDVNILSENPFIIVKEIVDEVNRQFL